MSKNNFENLLNNPDLNNLFGNFVKVINNNLEESIHQKNNENIHDTTFDTTFDSPRKSGRIIESDSDEPLSPTELISENKTKDTNIENILSNLLTDKNGNKIADILSDISSKMDRLIALARLNNKDSLVRPDKILPNNYFGFNKDKTN